MSPRLLILTQYFPPEMGAPQVRLSELGECLIDRGWQVEALTALPNYPTGKVFAGYPQRRAVRGSVGRIPTVRAPLWPSRRGQVARLATYYSFVASACWFGRRLCARPDLLYVESPPLFIGHAARYLARHWRCRYVLNISDLWPESLVPGAGMKSGVLLRALERLELSFYRHAAGVTAQSEEAVSSVRRRSPGTPAAVITNGVDPARFGRALATAGARALLGTEPGPIFLYAGLLGGAQGLDQVLDLAASLPAELPGRFVLVGDGAERERLAARIEREQVSRVQLLPAQPRATVPTLLACADVAVVTLARNIPGSVPSKIYEAMASELPILLIAEGEAARRVEEAECGVAVRPGDQAGAREAFVRLAGDAGLRARLGRAGRMAAESVYDRAQIADRLDAFLRELLAA